MRKITYTVVSVNEDEAEVEAIVGGETIMAKVPSLTVEMVSSCGGMGHTFRFTQPTDEDRAMFEVGDVLDATFTAVEPEE